MRRCNVPPSRAAASTSAYIAVVGKADASAGSSVHSQVHRPDAVQTTGGDVSAPMSDEDAGLPVLPQTLAPAHQRSARASAPALGGLTDNVQPHAPPAGAADVSEAMAKALAMPRNSPSARLRQHLAIQFAKH